MGAAQWNMLRVPLADGTLVATPEVPSDDLVASLLTLSDVMGTGWFAADAANVKAGKTVAVVAGSNPRSVIFGQDTLFQLIRRRGGAVVLYPAAIRDWPSMRSPACAMSSITNSAN